MSPTDTSEKMLESIIVRSLVDDASYIQGDSRDYDRDHAVDKKKLLEFLHSTQPKVVRKLNLDEEGIKLQQFLSRLQGEITKRGIVDVLRKGISQGRRLMWTYFFGSPLAQQSQGCRAIRCQYLQHHPPASLQQDESQLALDLCLFINGLPLATFELKNSLTKQTAEDAVQQYKRDRNPRELSFSSVDVPCTSPWMITRL
jgi:type I restriction enzyme R subunit